MALALAPFGFLFGAAIGSFLNVLVLRGEKNESLGGRSYCPHCHHQLSWADNIPILSFLQLGGKCRYCHKPISWQYLLVELATAMVFALIFVLKSQFFLGQGLSLISILTTFYLLFFASVLIAISVADINWGIIPDKIILPASSLAFGFQVVLLIFSYLKFTAYNLDPFFSVFAAFGLGAFFLALILITRGKGMGVGDLKLVIFIGLSLVWTQSILAVVVAFLTGAIWSVILLLVRLKKLKQTIAFGPFLALGAIIATLFGNQIISLYLKFLGIN